MKKMRFYLQLIAALAIVSLLVWLSGIAAAYMFSPAAAVPETAVCTPSELRPGDTAEATVKVTLPANMRIRDPEISGSGIISYPPEVTPVKWLWNRRVWQISGRFKVLKTGNISGTELKFKTGNIFSSRTGGEFAAAVPELSSKLDQNETPEAELLLAGEFLPPEKTSGAGKNYFWIITAAALIFAGIGIWLWHRSRRTPPRPAWELALDEIEILRGKAGDGSISPERGFTKLCDLLRNYLELRGQLPASRLTTAEFLTAILRESSKLPESEKNFLRRFLATSDLIKFARLRSNGAAFDEAALRAEDFIRTTVPEVKK